jgi:hypothetical protein
MDLPADPLTLRLEKLGLACDHISLDQVTSATAALACLPMYMVANVHLWTDQRSSRVPVLNLPGVEEIREALEIARQQAQWELSDDHRRALGLMLSASKPADRVIYEFALETLRLLLAEVGGPLAETLRTGMAKMIVAVAYASGSGPFGTGEKVSPEERSCIRLINAELGLDRTEPGAWLMRQIGAN